MADDGLVAALARAQANFPPIVKSHTNPAFKGSQYADVADVLAAVRPVLAAEGIVVTQFTYPNEYGLWLVTAVRFGADSMKSEFPLAVEGLTAQQVGSLMTYHRRYQLCALLGVHPVGDDDDGNAASTARVAEREPAASDESREALRARVNELDPVDSHKVANWMAEHRIPSLKKSGATNSQLNELADYLTQLTTEPWPVEGEGEAGGVREAASNFTAAAPSRPEPADKPFEPHVWNPETGKSEPVNPVAAARKSLAGSERKRLDSASKADV